MSKAEKKRCVKKTKKGKACRSWALHGLDVCMAHAPAEVRESAGFIPNNGKGGRPPNPRAVDVLRERLEQRIDEVLDPLFDALKADQGLALNVKGGGMEIGYVPDHATRIKAVRELLDRAYGRAKQATEISGPGGGPIPTETAVPADSDFEERFRRGLEEAGLAVNGNGAGANGSG